MWADLADYVFDHLRLDADHDDVGAFDGFDVVGADFHFQFRSQCFGSFWMRNRGAGRLSREQAILQQGLQNDAAHFACAQKCDSLSSQIIFHS